MVAFKNLAIFALGATALVIERDAATIKNDLQTINTDTNTLISKVNAYNGGINAALPIQDAYTTVDNDVKNGNTDAGNSAAVSSTDAQSLIDYINQTLEPTVASAISALEKKKPNFDADGLSGTVLNDLKTLKNDTDTFGASLIAKTPSAKQSNAKSALAKIDTDLQGGINYFS